jgi:diketogulonate reductase-like aldo/keto reductase
VTVPYRRLGRTGALVAPLALGTDNILNPTPEDESSRMIISALDAGINLIDTSDSYRAGDSERVIGRDGRSYPAHRGTLPETEARQDAMKDAIAGLVKEGKQSQEIIALLQVRPDTVAEVRRSLGMGRDNTKSAVALRRARIATMAAEACTSRQIAAALGITTKNVTAVAKAQGIDIAADRVVGRSHLHNANRIVEHMAQTATNLCGDVALITYTNLTPETITECLRAFRIAQRQMTAFVRRLLKEQQRHGKATASPVEDSPGPAREDACAPCAADPA